MARDFDDLEKPVFKSARHAVEGKLLEPTESTPRLLAARTVEGRHLEPMKTARHAVEGKLLEPTESTPQVFAARRVEGRLLQPMKSAHVVEGRHLEPTESGHVVEGRLLEPTKSARILATPAMPAISSYSMRPEFSTAYVGGQPLPDGYQLVSLNPFGDGSTRVDANLYDSVTPLGGTPVTTPDGTPIGGEHLFVVKPNPAVDATVPGYQPLIMSYAPDGTPTPIFVGP